MDQCGKIGQFLQIEESILAYNHAIAILYFDSLTNPRKLSNASKSKTMGFLTSERHELMVGQNTWSTIASIQAKGTSLAPDIADKIRFFEKFYCFERSIDKADFKKYMELVHISECEWSAAKKDNSFGRMQPFYQGIIDYQKQFAHDYNAIANPYDVLLDRYEEGFSQADYDAIFEKIKSRLLPLISKINRTRKTEYQSTYQTRASIQSQKQLSQKLMEIMKLDEHFCSLGETEHPFTIKVCRNDIRITTKYNQDDFSSSMYTILHEGGHALYEHYMDEVFDGSCLCEGTSMGMHEGQSRFFENYIGKNGLFLKSILPIVNQTIGGNISYADFYKGINCCCPSLIRTEADELTYPIHILIRYEIEKALFNNQISVAELPRIWNALYHTYLGVVVPDDTRGILQDSHWSGGSFAYFPSYLMGSAYAAQIYSQMQQEIDMETALATLDFTEIIYWLNQKVYQFGPTKTPKEIIADACGNCFSIDYYLDYLEKKYTKLYSI